MGEALKIVSVQEAKPAFGERPWSLIAGARGGILKAREVLAGWVVFPPDSAPVLGVANSFAIG